MSLNKVPYKIKNGDVEQGFVQITADNLKAFNREGQVFWIMSRCDQQHKWVMNIVPLRPRFRKGKLRIDFDPACGFIEQFIREEESEADYNLWVKTFFDFFIGQGQLYIKAGSTLTKYTYSK